MPETVSQIEGNYEDIEDETFSERLWGLTEMFPEKLRSAASNSTNLSSAAISKLYSFVRSSMWVGTTSFMILIVPVLFEQERFNLEQQQQQHQRQILLGPNAAVSNMQGGIGLAPPPPTK
uniref:Mitochondrial import receptor subunit TOM22 homolog n=1 Tax=Ciona savignyi TaxID=51511 RepID=H2ZPX5_CIOSA